MDYTALQARLRSFAAARDWQSRHTPKNLAMALTVEAAGLLEMFQWTTLTESRGVVRDPTNKERVADGIAGVLLGLLQLADHTGVDVQEAVEQKLRENAHKYPPKHPQLEPPVPDRPGEGAVAPTLPAAPRVHLLVDWENVQPKGDELQALVPQGTDVWLFHGPHQKVDAAGHQLAYGPAQVTPVPRSGTGRNALDFQLAYYVGYISARQPDGAFWVISNDQGYESMLAHARELGFAAQRREFRRAPPPAADPAPAGPAPGPLAVEKPVQKTAIQIPEKTAAKKASPAQARPARTQATRADMQQLLAQLDGLSASLRPAQKDALLVLLQNWLGEPSARSARTLHALAQLQARKRVVVKGEAVSFPPVAAAPSVVKTSALKAALKAAPKAAPSKAVTSKAAPAQRASAPKAPPQQPAVKKPAVSDRPKPPVPTAGKTPAKPAPPPNAAQVARAVLASLQKMTTNKPRQRSGLLKHIQSHAARAEDPAAMAQRVLRLLEARKDVVAASDGQGIAYFSSK